jgi:pimeloyl-ACP methyl ester carboxylesterase
MPIAAVNGIRLSYERYGSGEPVVMLAGSASKGNVWILHQVPALTAAGYEVITVDNRGIPPTDTCPEGFTLDDMVEDTAGLIKLLGISPCRVVGFSLGAMIALDLLLAYPELVKEAVLMATRGRTDALRSAMITAGQEIMANGHSLPPHYLAVMRAVRFLSPATQNNEALVRDWLDIFEMSPVDPALAQTQLGLDMIGNRLDDYRKIRTRSLVISFKDDTICPPHFGREVMECIPSCEYREIGGCGHYGYLEEPGAVNSAIIDFFQR